MSSIQICRFEDFCYNNPSEVWYGYHICHNGKTEIVDRNFIRKEEVDAFINPQNIWKVLEYHHPEVYEHSRKINGVYLNDVWFKFMGEEEEEEEE